MKRLAQLPRRGRHRPRRAHPAARRGPRRAHRVVATDRGVPRVALPGAVSDGVVTGSHGGRLDGKVAIVARAPAPVSAGQRRGSFAAEGASVVLADISGQEAEAAATIGDTAVAVHVDVASSRRHRRHDRDSRAAVRDPRRVVQQRGLRRPALAAARDRRGVVGQRLDRGQPQRRVPRHEVRHSRNAAHRRGFDRRHRVHRRPRRLEGPGRLRGRERWRGADDEVGGARLRQRRHSDQRHLPGNDVHGPGGCETRRRAPPSGAHLPQPMARWGLPRASRPPRCSCASDESSFITGAAIPG